MVNKVDFENLRGSFSKAMGALKPNAKQVDVNKYMEKFDAVIKPMVNKYDEIDVLVKLTFKNLKGEVRTTTYRPIQKSIEIPEDTIYFSSTIKLVVKVGEVVLETKDVAPFFKTPTVYIEENLTARQQETMREKIQKKQTLSAMLPMEVIEEYSRKFITFKPLKSLSL